MEVVAACLFGPLACPPFRSPLSSSDLIRWQAGEKAFADNQPVLQNRTMVSTLENLDRRVTALEAAQGETTQTLRWVVTKLARIQAVQDEHTLRLERVESKVDGIETRLGNVETRLGNLETRLGNVERKLDGLIEALPGIVAEAVRSVR
jgi:chromosome segregation ATPase